MQFLRANVDVIQTPPIKLSYQGIGIIKSPYNNLIQPTGNQRGWFIVQPWPGG